jgi:TRAP-type C4-dicarboxylate transport system permease small subunit
VYPRWSDEIPTEAVPRYGRKVRLLALIVVIALILLTVVPVLVRVTRQEPSPSTTSPGVVAARAIE